MPTMLSAMVRTLEFIIEQSPELVRRRGFLGSAAIRGSCRSCCLAALARGKPLVSFALQLSKLLRSFGLLKSKRRAGETRAISTLRRSSVSQLRNNE